MQGYPCKKMSKRRGDIRKEPAPSTKEAQVPSLHRCSFFPYQPAAITHIAATPAGCLPQVAVIRATEPTTLEIYTPSSDWAVERIIYGRAGENFECAVFVGPALGDNEMEIVDSSEDEIDISSAVAKNSAKTEIPASQYVQDTAKLNSKHILPFSESDKLSRARLFTAGVDGRVREWSSCLMGACVELFSIDIHGGAIWSLAVSPDQKTMAIGCEDGRIRLYSIYEKSIEFLRGFEAIEASSLNSSARILSLAWNPQGDALISGSASGSVKLWNCQTGRPIHSIKLPGLSVWSVAFCDNSKSFITGDSKGQVQFWDSGSGTLLQSFPAFGADVLSVAIVAERVFATGVDHKIVEFVQVTAPNAMGHVSNKWIQGGVRYFHTHDVRSLASLTIKYQKDEYLCERQVLVSGGVDCTLVISDPIAFDRALEKEAKAFNSHQRRILPFPRNSPLIQMARDVPVLAGRIGTNTVQIWKLAESKTDVPVHLADLKLSRYEPITSFAISPSGQFVCILTSSEFKLFQITNGSIKKIETVPQLKMTKKSTFPHLVAFSTDQTICLFNSQEMIQLTLSENESDFGFDFQQVPTKLNVSARLISVNESTLVFCTDRKVFKVENDSVKEVYESSFPITAITSISNDKIVISDSRNSLIQIGKGGQEVFDNFISLPREWKIRKEPVLGIFKSLDERLFCWTDASIMRFCLKNTQKRKKSTESTNESEEVKIIDDYRPILFFANIPNSLDSVVIERPWISIVENFPPAFYRSRYGAQ